MQMWTFTSKVVRVVHFQTIKSNVTFSSYSPILWLYCFCFFCSQEPSDSILGYGISSSPVPAWFGNNSMVG